MDAASERRWWEQWKAAGPALEQQRRQELRDLTDARALSASEAVLGLFAAERIPEERRRTSGLVEQQRLFHSRGSR